MDRREALKKLGIAGAVAAGGSVVLSSNAVAAAISGTCVVIPDSVTYSITYASQTAQITASGFPTVPNPTLSWAATIVSGQQVVRIANLRGNTNPTVVERAASANGSLKNWSNGDVYDVTLRFIWDCGGGVADQATFRGRITYLTGRTTDTVSAARISPP